MTGASLSGKCIRRGSSLAFIFLVIQLTCLVEQDLRVVRDDLQGANQPPIRVNHLIFLSCLEIQMLDSLLPHPLPADHAMTAMSSLGSLATRARALH